MQETTLDNKTVAAHFKLLGDLMELHGEGGFKSAAYLNAYRALKNYDIPLISQTIPQLEEIPGIGKAIASKIHDLLHLQTFPLLEKYLALTPPGVIELLQIKGIGPKKIALLWKELNVESPGELYYACTENRLVTLPGFGAKTQQNILDQLIFMQQSKGQLLYAQAEPIMLQITNSFKSKFSNNLFESTGEIRRKSNTVSAITFITDLSEEILISESKELGFHATDTHLFFRSEGGVNLQFFTSSPEKFALDRFKTTGNEEHVNKILKAIPDQTYTGEDAIYAAGGFPFMSPETRENLAEWNWVTSGKALIKTEDIKGIIHAHSTYSDGTQSLKELATYCKDQGFEYLAISDHSQSAFYANGLKENDLIRQHKEIDDLNLALSPFKIFKSIESDILFDGRLDYPDYILDAFDLVIASVHSNLKMDEEKATSRLIAAIENPHTTILGHATGRLLLSRPGYPIDHKKVIEACATNGVCIEINANPYRLDMDWTWIPLCIEKGVMISINPDAHNLKGVHDIRYGVNAARKACLTADNCLNAMDAVQIAAYFQKRKNRH